MVEGRYAYLIYSYPNNGGLQIIDVSNLSNPVVVSTLTTGNSPLSVQLDGHYAYVTGTTTTVVEISNPLAPVVVASTSTAGVATSLEGQNLYTINSTAQTISSFSLGGYGLQLVALDPAHDRLFATDATGQHVLVYAINADGTLASQTPLFVIGVDSPSGAVSQSSIATATGLVYDPVANLLFVSDAANNRVLVFNAANLASGMAASYVLGQATFASSGSATSQTGLSAPAGLAFDPVNNRLFVADEGNNRILEFDVSNLSNGMAASYVLGQPNFTSSSSATSQTGLTSPTNLIYDSVHNQLFVSDSGNNRVLDFNTSSLANGMPASFVLGQSNFMSTAGLVGSAQLNFPTGLALDSSSSRLFVADENNNRVLTFSLSGLSNGMAASDVLGQANFSSGAGGAQMRSI